MPTDIPINSTHSDTSYQAQNSVENHIQGLINHNNYLNQVIQEKETLIFDLKLTLMAIEGEAKDQENENVKKLQTQLNFKVIDDDNNHIYHQIPFKIFHLYIFITFPQYLATRCSSIDQRSYKDSKRA